MGVRRAYPGAVLVGLISVVLVGATLAGVAPAQRNGLVASPMSPSSDAGTIPIGVTANRTFIPLAGDPGTGRPLGLSPPALDPRPFQTGNGGQIVDRIPIQGYPYPGVFDNRTGDLYVSDEATGNVSVINTTTESVIATIPVGDGPQMGCLDPVAGMLYVSNFFSGNVSVISTANDTDFASLSLWGYEPTTCTYDPLTGDVYIPNPNYSTNYANVTVVYGANHTIKTNINVAYGTGIDPITPTFDPANQLLYVAMSSGYYGSNWVVTINASQDTVPTTINVGSYPTQPAYDPVNNRLYVSNDGGQYVSVINGSNNHLLPGVTVGWGPNTPAVDPTSGDVFVPVYLQGPTGNITVLNASTDNVSNVVTVGQDPLTPYADAEDGDLYVPNAQGDNLTVLAMSNDSTVGNYSIGSSPQTPVPDALGDLYVPYTTTSYLDGAVAVIASPILHARLSALPTPAILGDPLTITTTAVGGSGTLTFDYANLPPGCSTNDVAILSCTPSQAGTFDVSAVVFDTLGDETNASLNVTILQAYNVTFAEAGLPVGDAWFLNGTGLPSVRSVTANATVHLPDGVYQYHLASGNKDFAPTPPTIPLHVAGSASVVDLNFTLVTYAVTFNAGGLPNGTDWYVNVTGEPPTVTSSPHAIVALDNGTHRFTIVAVDHRYGAAPGAGVATIRGGPATINVTFRYETFEVAFDASGLPSQAAWYLNVTGGESLESTAGVVSMLLANGTYPYTLATADKSYAPTTPAGTLLVAGYHAPVNATFAAVTFPVTFQEQGLPLAFAWSVHIGSVVLLGTTPSLNTSLMNGTFAYTIGAVAGWHTGRYGGSVTVHGATPTPIEVNWNQTVYAVTFTAAGIGDGTSWSVTVGNSTYRSQLSTLNVDLANGSYAYSFSSVAGYALTNGSGELYVTAGASGPTAFYSSQGSGLLSGPGLYVIVVAIAAAVVVAALVLVLRRRRSAGVDAPAEPAPIESADGGSEPEPPVEET